MTPTRTGSPNSSATHNDFCNPASARFHRRRLSRCSTKPACRPRSKRRARSFPQSDRALHVRDLLIARSVDAGVTVHSSTEVTAIDRSGENWRIQTRDGSIDADCVIVTVGGKSYPGCGTTGDGYAWLKKLGHTIIQPRPALVPLVGGTDWTRTLSGLTLEDVSIVVKRQGTKQPVTTRRGSWLFTHFGFSGPAAMDVSGAMTAQPSIADLQLTVDLLPELSRKEFASS